MKSIFIIITISSILFSCSGENNPAINLNMNSSKEKSPASNKVNDEAIARNEVSELNSTYNSSEQYRINNEEIENLKNENILTEEELAQLQALSN